MARECQNAAISLPLLGVVAEAALPPGLVAFPNVRLQDVFYISAKGEVYARFQDKHIDFLVVSVREYRPVLVIELDASSHDGPSKNTGTP